MLLACDEAGNSKSSKIRRIASKAKGDVNDRLPVGNDPQARFLAHFAQRFDLYEGNAP